jgi:hypothetical protein
MYVPKGYLEFILFARHHCLSSDGSRAQTAKRRQITKPQSGANVTSLKNNLDDKPAKKMRVYSKF